MLTKKGKYTKEIITAIVNTLAETGDDASAVEAAGISRATFYKWINEKPEFAQKVNQSKELYRANLPSLMRNTAKTRLNQVLRDGQQIKAVRTVKTKKEHFNAKGDLIWWEMETSTDETTSNMGVPQWAIERVLGKPVQSLDEAMKLLEAHGLKAVVADAELFREWLIAQTKDSGKDSEGGSGDRGISEATANEIRARILGISTDASGTTALSGEVDRG